MSVDSELHERAQKVAARREVLDLYWENDWYIDRKTGRILARIVQHAPRVEVIMNGEVVGEFMSIEQAKRWVEQQNL